MVKLISVRMAKKTPQKIENFGLKVCFLGPLLKSGLRILIQAPKVPFLVPPKQPK